MILLIIKSIISNYTKHLMNNNLVSNSKIKIRKILNSVLLYKVLIVIKK